MRPLAKIFSPGAGTRRAVISLGVFGKAASQRTLESGLAAKVVAAALFIVGSFIAVPLARGALVVSNHNVGSAPDAFGEHGAETNVLLYRFMLTAQGEPGPVAVTQLRDTLSGVVGIVAGDITNARLFEDVNGDGVMDGGDMQRGVGAVSISGGNGSITWTGAPLLVVPPTPPAPPVQFLVVCNVANLAGGDQLAIALRGAAVTTMPPVATSGNAGPSTHVEAGLSLSNHSAGQAPDAFTEAGSATDAEIYRFRLSAQGESVTLTQFVFPLTSVSGLATGDMTNIRLFDDLNGDGAVSGGEPQVGGAGTGSISGATGSITFTGSLGTVAPGSPRQLLLVATFPSLQGGDTFTIDLSGVTSTPAVTPTGDVSPVTHVEAGLSLSNHSAGQAPDAFTEAGSATDAVIYRFRLAGQGQSVNVTNFTFDISDANGLATADLTNLRLFEDLNGDGVVSGGDPQVNGPGMGSISGATGSITFTGSLGSVVPGSPRQLLLIATFPSLQGGDTFTIDLSGVTSTPAVTPTGDVSPATHVEAGLSLSEHTVGSAPDAFGENGGETGALLYRFRLTGQGQTVNVTGLQFSLTSVVGIVTGDMTNAMLIRDLNGDGVVSGGEPQVGGAGGVSIAGPSGSMTWTGSPLLSVAAAEQVQLLVVCNVANLAGGDHLTTDLDPSGVQTASLALLTGNPSSVTHSEGQTPHSAGNIIWGGEVPFREFGPYMGINPGTGEVHIFPDVDLDLSCPMPLFFGRIYASLLASDGIAIGNLGSNWRGTFDNSLSVAGSSAIAVDNSGRVVQFRSTSPGIWQLLRPLDVPYQLVQSGPNYVMGDPRDQRTYTYDGTGRLIRIDDGHGNTQFMTYTGSVLTTVDDGLGRGLSFGYNGSNQLISVADGTRTVHYSYTGNRLTTFVDAAGNVTTYTYDAGPDPARMTSCTLPRGNTPWTYAYDAQGRAITVTDPSAHTWSLGYAGLVTTLTDPLGHATTYHYNSDLTVNHVVDATGGTTTYTYDATGRRTSVTRPLGDVTTTSYHAPSGYPSSAVLPNGSSYTFAYVPRAFGGIQYFDLQSTTDPDATVISYVYDASGNLVKMVDRGGFEWTRTNNGNGLPLTLTNPAGGVIVYTYDSRARLATARDPAGNVTQYQYDALDRLIREIEPDAAERHYTYDALGRLVTVVDERSKTWSFFFNLNGLLDHWNDPLSNTTTYTYDPLDRLISQMDPSGHSIVYTYDAASRLSSVTDPTGRTTTYTYDAAGRAIGKTDPAGKSTAYTYDANGRLTSITDPLSHVQIYQYDALGRLVKYRDPLSNDDQYFYDSMSRLTGANGPLAYNRTFAYDARGLTTSLVEPLADLSFTYTSVAATGSIRDPNHQDWVATYDMLGRRTSVTDPLSRSTSYTYDSRGRLIRTVLPSGSLDYTYDATGRLLQRAYSDGVTLNYTYDDAHRLLTAPGLSYSYDANGRIVSSNGLTITHDDAGRVTGVTYAAGKTVTYSYESRGRVAQIQDWLGGTTQFTYDDAGRLTRIQRPNSAMTEYQYDAAGRRIQLMDTGPDGVLLSITLTRDARGQITAAARNAPIPAGVGPGTVSFSYDAASQIVGYTYDALGRLTNDGTRTYHWDLTSRLTGYDQGATSVQYAYDGLGRLIARTQGGVTHNWIRNDALGLSSIAIDRVGVNDIRYYLYAPTGELIYSLDPATNARLFYHYDEMGNTLFLTDDGGHIQARYAYTPYGKLVAASPDLDHLFTYSGQWGGIREGSTGLYLLHGRCYDSRAARFLSGDPQPVWYGDGWPYLRQEGWSSASSEGVFANGAEIGIYGRRPQYANPYQYALQNPLKYVDPPALHPGGPPPIAIVAILAAIQIPNFIKYQARSKQSEAKANLKALYTAEKAFYQEKDRYSTQVGEVGFAPERNNRYAYYLTNPAPDPLPGPVLMTEVVTDPFLDWNSVQGSGPGPATSGVTPGEALALPQTTRSLETVVPDVGLRSYGSATSGHISEDSLVEPIEVYRPDSMSPGQWWRRPSCYAPRVTVPDAGLLPALERFRSSQPGQFDVLGLP